MPRFFTSAVIAGFLLIGALHAEERLDRSAVWVHGGTLQETAAADPAAFGTGDLTIWTLPESAFTPVHSTVTWDWNQGTYLTSAGQMHANVSLPSGVSIEAFELDYCDSSESGGVIAGLQNCPVPPATGCPFIIDLGTSTPGAIGCSTARATLSTPRLVDNLGYRYMVRFYTTAGDATTRFRAVRILYRRQVSPAPSTATFPDVPVGHALHPFVEALAAASITAGCGGANFCPGDPITRGQMAVFLAKALGLHWPD